MPDAGWTVAGGTRLPSTWFDGLTLARHDDGTTTSAGLIQDQSQLQGPLDKVRDLGWRIRASEW